MNLPEVGTCRAGAVRAETIWGKAPVFHSDSQLLKRLRSGTRDEASECLGSKHERLPTRKSTEIIHAQHGVLEGSAETVPWHSLGRRHVNFSLQIRLIRYDEVIGMDLVRAVVVRIPYSPVDDKRSDERREIPLERAQHGGAVERIENVSGDKWIVECDVGIKDECGGIIAGNVDECQGAQICPSDQVACDVDQ